VASLLRFLAVESQRRPALFGHITASHPPRMANLTLRPPVGTGRWLSTRRRSSMRAHTRRRNGASAPILGVRTSAEPTISTTTRIPLSNRKLLERSTVAVPKPRLLWQACKLPARPSLEAIKARSTSGVQAVTVFIPTDRHSEPLEARLQVLWLLHVHVIGPKACV